MEGNLAPRPLQYTVHMLQVKQERKTCPRPTHCSYFADKQTNSRHWTLKSKHSNKQLMNCIHYINALTHKTFYGWEGGYFSEVTSWTIQKLYWQSLLKQFVGLRSDMQTQRLYDASSKTWPVPVSYWILCYAPPWHKWHFEMLSQNAALCNQHYGSV